MRTGIFTSALRCWCHTPARWRVDLNRPFRLSVQPESEGDTWSVTTELRGKTLQIWTHHFSIIFMLSLNFALIFFYLEAAGLYYFLSWSVSLSPFVCLVSPFVELIHNTITLLASSHLSVESFSPVTHFVHYYIYSFFCWCSATTLGQSAKLYSAFTLFTSISINSLAVIT